MKYLTMVNAIANRDEFEIMKKIFVLKTTLKIAFKQEESYVENVRIIIAYQKILLVKYQKMETVRKK